MSKKLPHVLFAAYECAPFYKEGGLGDVAGSLPKALQELGLDIRVVIPYYNIIKKNYSDLKVYKQTQLKILGKSAKVTILKSNLPDSKVPIYFIDFSYFQVDDIFEGKSRTRFLIFSYLITQLAKIINWQPDIIHTNDWHTGAVSLFAKQSKSKVKTLFTIHNIGYTGRTNFKVMEKFGFTQDDFSEVKKNKINLMREAILSATKVSTVSPNYAKEILTPNYGYDMAGALSQRKSDLVGITNGIDYTKWNPQSDPHIKTNYDLEIINKKVNNKLYLQEISNLPQNKNIPIIGMVSRLAGQKGFDILVKVFQEIMRSNLQLIILGTGNKEYEKFFAAANKKYPTKFKAHLKFDLKLARQIYAGADIFLMPSKYEPCGLGQLIAMRYGTIPLVRKTGGLKDTVTKPKNGFSFKNYDEMELLKSIQQAIHIYANPKKFSKFITKVIQRDFSWASSAEKYLKLYTKLIR